MVGILIVVGLLVALDFGAKFVAQSIAARTIQRRLDTTHAVDVEVDAFPFLVSAFRGRYDEIDVSTRGLRRGSVTLDSVRMRMLHVDLPLSDVLSGTADLHAADVRGTATVSEATLNSLVHNVSSQLDVSVDETGVTVSAAGLNVTTPADVAIGNGHLTIVPGSGLDPVEVPIPAVLPKIDFAEIATAKNRLIVTLTGHNVDVREFS